jgi:hypothetical protein
MCNFISLVYNVIYHCDAGLEVLLELHSQFMAKAHIPEPTQKSSDILMPWGSEISDERFSRQRRCEIGTAVPNMTITR